MPGQKEDYCTCPKCQGEAFLVGKNLAVTCAVCGASAGILLPEGDVKP